MVGSGVRVEADGLAAGVDLADEAGVRELLQVAVHGAEADARDAAAGAAVDPVRGRMVHRRADDLEHDLALPGVAHQSGIILVKSTQCQATSPPPPRGLILDTMRPVVAVVDDLMFLSRIREAAKRQGVEVRAVKTAAAAADACREGCLVILDLDSQRLPVMEAIASLTADSSPAGIELVGFYS